MNAPQDYFALLGLSRQFSLDEAALNTAYFALQRQHHPDRARNLPLTEQQRHAHLAVLANDAYNTLKNPLKRAEHLLELLGAPISSAKASPALLAEVMEWREELENATTAQAITAVKTTCETQENACISALEKACDALDIATAQTECLRLSYITKWREEIRLKTLHLKHQNAL